MTDSHLDFDYLRELVHQQTGVLLEPHKDYLAELHLNQLASQTGFESVTAFTEHLKQKPLNRLHIQSVESLLINETLFFRDYYPFEALQKVVLPALIQSRSSQRSITIWSAACSTGQEPYSIAMLIRESFPELSNWKIHLIATDFSQRSLDRAKTGQYTSLETSRGLPPGMRDRYFRQMGGSWQIIDEIRQMVEFRQLNLIHPWNLLSPAQVDVIFLRNVLIYFNVETKRSVLNKIQLYLRKDGYLFLGAGETTLQLTSQFESIHSKTSLYHRLKGV